MPIVKKDDDAFKHNLLTPHFPFFKCRAFAMLTHYNNYKIVSGYSPPGEYLRNNITKYGQTTIRHLR